MTNNLVDVERTAKMLMTAHGVGSLSFRFSKGTNQIAALHMARYRTPTGITNLAHTIALSKRWAMVMPASDLFEVMTHEIAHALTCNEGTAHGRQFKATVVRLGGRSTNRCFTPSVNIDGTTREVYDMNMTKFTAFSQACNE